MQNYKGFKGHLRDEPFPKDVTRDRLNRFMIDGRSIHFFFQFVYPLLLGSGNADTSANTHTPNVVVVNKSACTNFTEAQNRLSAARLGFFVEIACKVIATEGQSSVDTACEYFVDGNNDFALLQRAAVVFLDAFIQAEQRFIESKLQRTDKELLTHCFVNSVVFEYAVRCGHEVTNIKKKLPSIMDLQQLLERLEFRLVAELLCVWYPLWTRSLWIIESPIDYVSELSQIHSL